MTAEDLDLFRERILQLCRAANRHGLPPERILRTLQRSGWEADATLLARELRHLESSNLIAPADAAQLTPALISYVTTHHGDHFLERRGLL